MNTQIVDQIARAVLYQGFLLYPYRPTTLTHDRFNFGVVVPPGTGDGSGSQVETQCLVRAPASSTLNVQVRFLHLSTRHVEGGDWDEARERVVSLQLTLADGCVRPVRESFRWPGFETAERTQASLRGDVEVLAEPVGAAGDFFKVTVLVANTTSTPCGSVDRATVMRHSLVSAHVLIEAPEGRFVSLLDPGGPAETEAARACHQEGLWPVLVGEPGHDEAVLAAPLVLSDYPRVDAAMSATFFDATEVDQMLALQILALTDEEKQEMRLGDARARRLLERAEQLLATDVGAMHGLVGRSARLSQGDSQP